MFDRGDSVLMAVSGGPDSVALAHVLLTLAAEYSFQTAFAHLNHCLRGRDSDRDAEFVATMARQLDVPIYAEKMDVRAFQANRRLSLEEAGRMIRYEFYDAIAAKYGFDKIALGHHSDDNAELVLLNLLRGSGPLGLSGIAPVREGRIVRPLIQLKRDEIIDYLAEKKLKYVNDISNSDPAFVRNKIRHHLMPELQAHYNPKITETLNRLAEIIRAEDQWFDRTLEPVLKQCILSKTPGKINLDLTGCGQITRAVKRRVIRKAIRYVKRDLRRITFFHVDAVVDLIENGPVIGRLNLPDGILVQRDISKLIILKQNGSGGKSDGGESEIAPADYQYTMDAPGTLYIKEAGASIILCEIDSNDLPDFKKAGTHIAFFDWDRLSFPLVVRNLRPGDRFSPLGVRGSQKVKKYFINQKIPALERRKCPLLLSGGNIIWLAGHRIDNAVKLEPQTRRVLKAELLLA